MKSLSAPHCRLLGAVLAGSFFLGAFFNFLGAYKTLRMERRALRQLEIQLQGQQRTSLNMEQYAKAREAAADFVEKAGEAGFAGSSWQSFPVAIQRSMTFEEAAMVLGQALSTETYLFRPEFFKLTRTGIEQKIHRQAQADEEQTGEGQEAVPPAGGMAQALKNVVTLQASMPGGKDPKPPARPETKDDLQIMLNGSFLVRRK